MRRFLSQLQLQLKQEVNHIRTHQYDSIIAVGGGSPIDSAKAISIFGHVWGRDKRLEISQTGQRDRITSYRNPNYSREQVQNVLVLPSLLMIRPVKKCFAQG